MSASFVLHRRVRQSLVCGLSIAALAGLAIAADEPGAAPRPAG